MNQIRPNGVKFCTMIYLSVLNSSKLGTIVHHEMYGFYLVQNYALLIVNAAPPTFNEEMIFPLLQIVHKWCTKDGALCILHTIVKADIYVVLQMYVIR
jgi:hypothetical protein